MGEEKKNLIGSTFQDESGEAYRILSKIGGGTQGAIYLVEDSKLHKQYALKLLYGFNKKIEDRTREIMKLHEKKRGLYEELRGEYQIDYSWPLKIVNAIPGRTNGGYIMEYFPLGDCINYEQIENDFDEWDYKELCRVSIQMCRGFSGFHNAGYCYKDVSRDNLWFDMKTKSFYIIDLENVAVENGDVESAVWGTPGFMAPEISRREVNPNRDSDFFSIAVILFYMWSKGHPFMGKKFVENLVQIGEYMENPVFIFHPTDKSNTAETEEEYFASVIYWWNALPENLKELFQKAFVNTLETPKDRISVTQWITEFQKIEEKGLMKCSKCGKMIAKDAPYCGFCGEEKNPSPVSDPVKVKKTTKSKKTIKKIRVMEVCEDGKAVKIFRTDIERDISGEELSERLKGYKTALRFEKYVKQGTEKMALRNMMPYVNWTVIKAEDGKAVSLRPSGLVGTERARQIFLERGVTLTFAQQSVEE